MSSELTTEQRLPVDLPSYTGNVKPDRMKAPTGAPTFMRPAYTDPWSGQTYPWTPYTNLEEREVIILPRFANNVVAEDSAGISLRGVIQDSGITELDRFVTSIDWFWETLYSRLAFKCLQQGKRIAVTHLTDPERMRIMFEKWLFVAIGVYGFKSLWEADPSVPAVGTWRRNLITSAYFGDEINTLFQLVHSYPIPQGFADMAAYYGVGVAADTTGPVFVGLTSFPDDTHIGYLEYLARGSSSTSSYLTMLKDVLKSLTANAADWAVWQVLALMYPTPTPRSCVWRVDPEAVRLNLSEAVVRTTGGLTWLCNPRENDECNEPLLIPIHGKSPYAATLFRPQFMIGSGLVTPDWAWGSLGTVPWESTTVIKRESRLLVLPNRYLSNQVDWSMPDGSIDIDDGSNPWNQFLWGPPTIDDHGLTETQIMQHHRFQDESIAYIARQDMVMNTVALLERFFMGFKSPMMK